MAGDTLILGRDPTTVVRIILQGAESPVTPNEKTTYSMPAFAVLSDEQVAAVATYIRNSWGNHAEPVTPHEVRTLRAELQ
jgi:mono/diheme cytochrome c family protein